MKKTFALIIMDGYANRKETAGNAILAEGTPYINSLKKQYPVTEIEASGRAVGLPVGQIGNSEVGHLNLGAGRIVYQDITRIDKSIEDGDFFTNPAFMGAVANVKKNDSALHLVGLLSSGGVHSTVNHLYALLKLAKDNGVKKVFIHCLMDGRDVPPSSGKGFIEQLEQKIKEIGVGQVATVVGRYFYMDRDNRWERVEKGYGCVFDGIGENFDSGVEAAQKSYDSGKTDEFIEPTVIGGYKGVTAGDSMIFYNFRSDRAREITRAAIYPDFDYFERKGGFKKIFYVGMTQYDISFTNIATAYSAKNISNTLGEYLANSNKTQARIAETEKYAHVTFFFNGGVEEPNKNEQRVLVSSPKVATYDMQPEMSAYEVTEKALEVIAKGETDVIILNFANCDMVGHTGIFDAAVKAVRTVDECLQKVVDKILATGGSALVTADHGNAEMMSFPDGSPCTSHTTNPVPFILVSEQLKKSALRAGGNLADVAPTLLEVMDMKQPKEMDGKSLLKK